MTQRSVPDTLCCASLSAHLDCMPTWNNTQPNIGRDAQDDDASQPWGGARGDQDADSNVAMVSMPIVEWQGLESTTTTRVTRWTSLWGWRREPIGEEPFVEESYKTELLHSAIFFLISFHVPMYVQIEIYEGGRNYAGNKMWDKIITLSLFSVSLSFTTASSV